MLNPASGNAAEDLGKLILRVVLSVLILLHGIAKVVGGIGFISGLVAKAGLPPFVAYFVYVGEVLAPLMILFGIWTRIGALIIAINMIAAFGLVHMADLLSLSQTGGWALELQGMYLASALAVVLLGAGRYSFGGANGKFN